MSEVVCIRVKIGTKEERGHASLSFSTVENIYQKFISCLEFSAASALSILLTQTFFALKMTTL